MEPARYHFARLDAQEGLQCFLLPVVSLVRFCSFLIVFVVLARLCNIFARICTHDFRTVAAGHLLIHL